MRRLNWRRIRWMPCFSRSVGRHAECGPFCASVVGRDGTWGWIVRYVDRIAKGADPLCRERGVPVCEDGGTCKTRRDAMRAARKALARMGLQ